MTRLNTILAGSGRPPKGKTDFKDGVRSAYEGGTVLDALTGLWNEINSTPARVYDIIFLCFILWLVFLRLRKVERRLSALEKEKQPPGRDRRQPQKGGP
jgi:hypothetical protein